ncbi:hypothetical protein IACHDJAJ_00091 [Aeromonas phage vB_AdhS_TS3]|nr:hypothetical protein IACHDJAJ_00091 [Aeromonas phage vB_AdhS_TS3]
MKHKTELLDLLDRWFAEIDFQEGKISATIEQTPKKVNRVGGRARRVAVKLINVGIN